MAGNVDLDDRGKSGTAGENEIVVRLTQDRGGSYLERTIGTDELFFGDLLDIMRVHVVERGMGENDDIATDLGLHVRHVDFDAPRLEALEHKEDDEDEGDDEADFPRSRRLFATRLLPGKAGGVQVNGRVRLGGVAVVDAVMIRCHGSKDVGGRGARQACETLAANGRKRRI